jgi:hypothetical protein
VVFSLGLKVVMARGRRLRKSGGGELEVNKQNVIVLDEAILLPNVVILLLNVAAGDEAVADPHVVALDAAIVEQNIAASDEAIGD